MEGTAVGNDPNSAAPRPTTKELLGVMLARVLGRKVGPRMIDAWAERLKDFETPAQFINALMQSPLVQNATLVTTMYEPGHYFSPVVNPDLVRGYVNDSRRASIEGGLAGIIFPLSDMEEFWHRNRTTIAATPFPEHPSSSFRYCFRAGPYGYGDATTLRAILAERRPQRVIEIGSGFSSACMLDTIDEFSLQTKLTCIEPYPGRLQGLLRDDDYKKVSILAEGVQGQPLKQFAELEPNDILFIDSSHVLKTGSDVHYELFYILSVLKPGVLVHFHDCRYPLEYPDKLIFENNRSWNEIYGVRALLMYSTRFRVMFSGSFLAHYREAMVRETFLPYLINPGSALWLEVVDDGGAFGLEAVGGLQGFDSRMSFRPDQAPAVQPMRAGTAPPRLERT